MAKRYPAVRPFLLVLAVAAWFSVRSQGTPSIESGDYPTIGTRNTLSADTSGHVTVALGSPGENQTWTFTQSLNSREVPWEVVAPGDTPFFIEAFSQAEWALKSKQWISLDPIPLLGVPKVEAFFDVCYYQKMDAAADAAIGIGIGTTTPFFSGGYVYTSLSTDYAFPVTLGKQWQRNSEFAAPATLNVLGTPINTTVLTTDNDLFTVDASGTLVLPSGTFECVRIKQIRYVTLKGQLAGQWLTVRNDTLTTYEWWAKRVGLLLQVSSHSGEKNENFTDAGYVARLSSTNISTGVECTPDCPPAASMPDRCTLGQNYPNPFNPSTSIAYAISEPSHVEVAVYSLLGREIAVLDRGLRQAGTFTVSWDGRDKRGMRMPSGIYFCRLSAASLKDGRTEVQTRKLVMGE
jgi:hypothetical protein